MEWIDKWTANDCVSFIRPDLIPGTSEILTIWIYNLIGFETLWGNLNDSLAFLHITASLSIHGNIASFKLCSSIHQVSIICISSGNVVVSTCQNSFKWKSKNSTVLLVPIMCTKFLYEIMYYSECKCGIFGLAWNKQGLNKRTWCSLVKLWIAQ